MTTFNTSIDNEGTLNANAIYGGSIYHPRSIPSTGGEFATLESLNGNISYENFVPFRKTVQGSRDGLEASSFRAGMFARGYYYGFDFPDRFHASQYIKSDSESVSLGSASARLFHTHPSLAVRFFCPWPATCYLGIQGFFSGDLTRFKNLPSGSEHLYGEQWVCRVISDGTHLIPLDFVVPSTRSGKKGGEATKTGNEHRYRWVNRSQVYHFDKGFHTFHVDMWPRIHRAYNDDGDKTDPKIQNRCGGIWVLAIRDDRDEEETVADQVNNDSAAIPGPGEFAKGGRRYQVSVDNIVTDRNFDTAGLTEEGLEKYNQSSNRTPSLNDNPAINVILPEDNQ